MTTKPVTSLIFILSHFRGFGVHISKVRSITLDAWEPECIKVVCELGNNVVNGIYLVNVDESFTPATPECSR